MLSKKTVVGRRKRKDKSATTLVVTPDRLHEDGASMPPLPFMKNQAGKGDRYRPVKRERYSKNWEKIFGKKKTSKKKKPK